MQNHSHKYTDAAIMVTDIVGYTAMIRADEQRTLTLHERWRQILERLTEKYGGEIIRYRGDGSVSMFESGDDALHCALQLQKELYQSPKVPLSIGIHIGDIVISNENIYGEGLNIASRLERIGSTGSILFSKAVAEKIVPTSVLEYQSLGEFNLKNVDNAIPVFALSNPGLLVPTPDFIHKKSTDKKEIKSNSGMAALNYWLLPLIGLLLIASFFLLKKDSAQKTTPTTIQNLDEKSSLAIIPFQVFSTNDDDLVLGQGTAEDILMQLSNISDLKIISINSSMRYDSSTLSVKEIGEELNVDHLLQGSIRKIEDRYRISIQLINTNTDQYIWTKQFDRQSKDVFATQSEISIEVAKALKTKLLPDERARIHSKPTSNLEAYQLYSKARYRWNDRSEKNMNEALRLLTEAVKLDSTFALGYAGLSQAYTISATYGYVTQEIGHLRSENFAKKAIEIDKDLAEAYVALGALKRYFDADYENTIKYLRKGASLKPNYALAHHWLGYNYINLGWNELAKKEISISRALDPYSVPVKVLEAELIFEQGKLETAERMLTTILKETPKFSATRMFLIDIYIAQNNKEKALEMANGYGDELNEKQFSAYIYAKMDSPRLARKLLDEALPLTIERYGNGGKLTRFVATVLEAENKIDELFQFLEDKLHDDKKELHWLIRFPLLEKTQKDPRYKNLIARAGLFVDKNPT